MSDMDSDPRWHSDIASYVYNAHDPGTIPQPAGPPCSCEHDEKKHVFRITGPDGRTTEFHDRAVRFLVVVPDPSTGQLEPLINGGRPRVISLCREAGLSAIERHCVAFHRNRQGAPP